MSIGRNVYGKNSDLSRKILLASSDHMTNIEAQLMVSWSSTSDVDAEVAVQIRSRTVGSTYPPPVSCTPRSGYVEMRQSEFQFQDEGAEQTGPDLYSLCAWFESRAGHPGVSGFIQSLHKNSGIEPRIGHDRLIPNSFKLISYLTILHYILRAS
jgi:hypothetical protein